MYVQPSSTTYTVALATSSVAFAGLYAFYKWLQTKKQLHEEQERRQHEEVKRNDERKGRITAEKRLRELVQKIDEQGNQEQTQNVIRYTPIGYLRSVFPTKNGCPRQGLLVQSSRATLKLEPHCNPTASLEGLESFSHCWLIFVFHENTNQAKSLNLTNSANVKSKVSPPRLKGEKVGLYATRTPHRHNNIGLSVACIDHIDKQTGILHLRGIDLIDGTPILDIKPYIDEYDNIPSDQITMPEWIQEPLTNLVKKKVVFSDTAEQDLIQILDLGYGEQVLTFYTNDEMEQLQSFISEVISYDVRSVHKQKMFQSSDSHFVQLDRLRVSFTIATQDDEPVHTITRIELQN
jgi:tRNA-Thr(GGU) m(6)t(6)A37 methyltransferase TsaA